MTLQKKIKRSLKKNLSFYITGSILTALCIMLWVGAFSVSRTITSTYTELFDETALEDGQFTVSTPLTDEDIASLESEFDVLLERQRRAYYIQLGLASGTVSRLPATAKLKEGCVYGRTMPQCTPTWRTASPTALISE